MFNKTRRPRQMRPTAPSPVSEMEQFYLNQYFQTPRPHPMNGPVFPPEAMRHPPEVGAVSLAQFQALEQRLLRLENQLGLAPLQTRFDPTQR